MKKNKIFALSALASAIVLVLSGPFAPANASSSEDEAGWLLTQAEFVENAQEVAGLTKEEALAAWEDPDLRMTTPVFVSGDPDRISRAAR